MKNIIIGNKIKIEKLIENNKNENKINIK